MATEPTHIKIIFTFNKTYSNPCYGDQYSRLLRFCKILYLLLKFSKYMIDFITDVQFYVENKHWNESYFGAIFSYSDHI